MENMFPAGLSTAMERAWWTGVLQITSCQASLRRSDKEQTSSMWLELPTMEPLQTPGVLSHLRCHNNEMETSFMKF